MCVAAGLNVGGGGTLHGFWKSEMISRFFHARAPARATPTNGCPGNPWPPDGGRTVCLPSQG